VIGEVILGLCRKKPAVFSVHGSFTEHMDMPLLYRLILQFSSDAVVLGLS